MKNTIKHLMHYSLSGTLCLSSIIIGLVLPKLFGETYRDTGDTKYIAYTILSIAVSMIIYHIGVKLSIHKTKEDKQELYDKLLEHEPTNSDLMHLIEKGDIETAREKYDIRQYDLSEDVNDDNYRTRN